MSDLIKRLKEAAEQMQKGVHSPGHIAAVNEAVKRLTETPWISVEDRMPEEPFGCLLIVEDCEPFTGTDFPNYLPYFAGWDGDRWNDGDGEQVPFEVIYWMPLPRIPEAKDGE